MKDKKLREIINSVILLSKHKINFIKIKKFIELIINDTFKNKKELSINDIYDFISDYKQIPIDILNKKTRKREIVKVRQMAMFYSKLLTQESLQDIGKIIGHKDHATVIHACKTINNLIETKDKLIIKDIENLNEYFGIAC